MTFGTETSWCISRPKGAHFISLTMNINILATMQKVIWLGDTLYHWSVGLILNWCLTHDEVEVFWIIVTM